MRKLRRAGALVTALATASVAFVALGMSPAGAQDIDINISGSSTVEPITSRVVELYAADNPDVNARVDGPGTGDGFILFCNGETDASDASRTIEEDEAANCQANGIAYTELPVAIDGLTIVANKASRLKCLSVEQIYAIFGPESGGGTVNLKDANALAQDLGDTTKLPKGKVKKFTPGPESGTYDSFIDLTYGDIMDERLAEGMIPADKVGINDDGEEEVTEPQLSAGTFPNDNDIVRRVTGSKTGIGYFGYAYYQANKKSLKAIGVRSPDTGECVKPKSSTVQALEYPITRTLYVYANNAKVASKAELKAFFDFYMTEETLNDTVLDAGYVPLHDDEQAATMAAWRALSG